jgi:hypothetical protein
MGQIEYILSTNSLVESQLLCDFNWAYKVYITGTCISPFVCGYHPYISSINSGAPNILLSSIFIKNDVTGEQIIVFEPRSPSPYLLFLHINKKKCRNPTRPIQDLMSIVVRVAAELLVSSGSPELVRGHSISSS